MTVQAHIAKADKTTPGQEAAPGIPRSAAEPVNASTGRQLYAGREPIYPKRAHGKFRLIKWLVLAGTLGIYYLLPWLRWDRGPNLPDQAFLLDFAHQRLYMFGIEIWAQELYFITGLLIVSALALFLVTALAGRVWCGYTCPQTVWTDLMIAVEHFWQGDRNSRMRLAKQHWNFEKIWKLGATHISWLLIGLATGGAFVFYFRDAPTLMMEFINFEAPFIAYLFLGIFTATTYVLGGIAREQVCTYMCPWPRIQGAMFDADSLLITYRGYRGEPRGPHKKNEPWEGRGDCIDCNQCVAVCPMGIDIRHGPQLECIQCALCIDACDEIMTKIGRPPKLIAYDTFRNLDAASHGDRARIQIIRPRTILYSAALALVVIIMAFALSAKSVLDVNVQADRNPLFVKLSDGSIRNSYTVRILNKLYETRTYSLSIEGLPQAKFSILGMENGSALEIDVSPDNLRTLKAFVTLPPEAAKTIEDGHAPFAFVVRDLADGTQTSRETAFRGPDE
ncbi:MAG TPA: cytochrome c oxidase accessory protein CcoG [Hyphomicrobiales bacterium]|nr:cytochrome c oxidase accessory protein CcoG [Hyphomicrobiales bacterium]